jgi:hypothetical protein
MNTNTIEQHNQKISQEIKNLELFKLNKYIDPYEKKQIQSVIDYLKDKLIK